MALILNKLCGIYNLLLKISFVSISISNNNSNNKKYTNCNNKSSKNSNNEGIVTVVNINFVIE